MVISGTLTITNDRNGTTEQVPVQIDLTPAPPAG